MALTEELIKQQAPLAELTEEQIRAIVTLSVNDEGTSIGKRIGEIYGAIDDDIYQSFGIAKEQGEKTYDYVKRVGATVKSKLDEAKEYDEKMATLQQEKTDLEDKIKSGKGTEAISQKLKDTTDKLDQMKKQHQKEIEEWKKKAAESEGRVSRLLIDNQFEKALMGKTFKPEVGEDLQNTIVEGAKTKILSSFTPDFVDDGKGGQIMVFRNKDGQIQNNPDNGLNPYTAEELLIKELKPAMAETGQAGTGSKKPGGKGTQPDVMVSEAKTQMEADNIIVKDLLAKGLAKGSEQFDAEQKRIRSENKVDELPLR